MTHTGLKHWNAILKCTAIPIQDECPTKEKKTMMRYLDNMIR
jgi:hypothetical protein